MAWFFFLMACTLGFGIGLGLLWFKSPPVYRKPEDEQ